MTPSFIADFDQRRSHAKRYIALVARTERETSQLGHRRLDVDRLHILRAGTFLILYNLIEASARGAIQAIHDDMTARRVPFGELSLTIRREVIKGFKRNGDPDTHTTMPDMPVDFVTASLDVEHHFSGNVDARLLKAVAKTYQFSSDTISAVTRDGSDLLTIKNRRNDLAHGDKTYDEVGRDFTARQLISISIRSTSYVKQILLNVAAYIDQGGYRGPPAEEIDDISLFE